MPIVEVYDEILGARTAMITHHQSLPLLVGTPKYHAMKQLTI